MSIKVLLVDADLALLRTMRSAAASEGGGIELLTAQTWDEAHELLTIVEPALVVGGIAQSDAPELASLVQLLRRGMAVAALGPDVPELVRVAAAAGVAEYICTPVSSVAFFVRLQRLTRASPVRRSPSLTGFALADLLQLVSMSRLDMTLRVRSGDKSGQIVVAAGRLVHAEAGGELGMKAAVSVLDWPNSEVSSSRELPAKALWTTDVPLMELLVDAARQRDERQRDEADRRLQQVVSDALGFPGVVAAALLHAASRTEIHGAGTAAKGRTLARDWVLDALALAQERAQDERPLEIQISLDSCDVLACEMGATGIVMLVWCDPGELRSGTQLGLRSARERDAELIARAFSSVGLNLVDRGSSEDDIRFE